MRKSEQGFTLVELLIGMAILIIIMNGIYGVLTSSIRSYQYNFAQGENIQSGRQVLNEITKDIKNATTGISITTPSPNPTNSSTLHYSILADSYVVSLDSGTKAVVISKNGTARSIGTGRIERMLFTSVQNGAKREITIQLYLRDDPAQPMETTVTTLNDIP